MKQKYVIAFTCLSALSSFSLSANLITNPSFDTTPEVNSIAYADWNILSQSWDVVKTKGTGYSWAVFSVIPGWQNFYGTGIELHASGTVKTNAGVKVNAVDGGNYIELDSHFNSSTPGNSNYGIYQLISGLVPGVAYDLSFWYRARTTLANDNLLNVYWADAATNLAQGDYIARYDYNSLRDNHNQWVQYTLRLQATNETMKLGFGGGGNASWGMKETFNGNGKGASLDSLSLTEVSAPAGAAIFALGLGVLALRRQKPTLAK